MQLTDKKIIQELEEIEAEAERLREKATRLRALLTDVSTPVVRKGHKESSAAVAKRNSMFFKPKKGLTATVNP